MEIEGKKISLSHAIDSFPRTVCLSKDSLLEDGAIVDEECVLYILPQTPEMSSSVLSYRDPGSNTPKTCITLPCVRLNKKDAPTKEELLSNKHRILVSIVGIYMDYYFLLEGDLSGVNTFRMLEASLLKITCNYISRNRTVDFWVTETNGNNLQGMSIDFRLETKLSKTFLVLKTNWHMVAYAFYKALDLCGKGDIKKKVAVVKIGNPRIKRSVTIKRLDCFYPQLVQREPMSHVTDTLGLTYVRSFKEQHYEGTSIKVNIRLGFILRIHSYYQDDGTLVNFSEGKIQEVIPQSSQIAKESNPESPYIWTQEVYYLNKLKIESVDAFYKKVNAKPGTFVFSPNKGKEGGNKQIESFFSNVICKEEYLTQVEKESTVLGKRKMEIQLETSPVASKKQKVIRTITPQELLSMYDKDEDF